MLKNAGISVLLDMHAAPGAQTPSNAFTGYCTASPGFWTQSNFDVRLYRHQLSAVANISNSA